MMTIEDSLLDRFGPLLSLPQLATVLDRSPEGLRISLRSNNYWAAEINQAKLRVGRRVYFRTSQIAELLDSNKLCSDRG
ncbi:DNA-binding protein [Marinobacterium alkalitolerans]